MISVKNHSLFLVFWLLVFDFIFLAATFFVPAIMRPLSGPRFLLLPLSFFLLSLGLILAVRKQKVKKPLRKYLLLTGISGVGFFLGMVLHNLFYALAIISPEITVLKWSLEALHVIFFIIAVPLSPSGFLVGLTGSVLLMLKKKS